MEEFNIELIDDLLKKYGFEYASKRETAINHEIYLNESNSSIIFNNNRKTTSIKINNNLVFHGNLKTLDDLDKILSILGFTIKNQDDIVLAKDILYKTKDKYNIGKAWQLTEHIILEAMEEYSKLNQVKQIKDIDNYVVFIDADDGLMQLSRNFDNVNDAINYSNKWKFPKTYIFGEIKIDK